MSSFDLHMHSYYSGDGQYSPFELVEIAKSKGLKTIALTDHNSIHGVKEIMEIASKHGIDVIGGLECSTRIDEIDVHLLGYGIDLKDPYFVNLYDNVECLSKNAFHTRVEKLRDKYHVEIDEEQVLRDSHGKNPWFLMLNQLFNDPRYQDIPDFKDYIPGGKRSDPAPVNFFWDKCQSGSDLYVFVDYPDFKETVQKIHEAGGLAIVAHPFTTFYKKPELLQYLLDCGIDGIEAYSNYHDHDMNSYYEDFARTHNLLISCGSDFHGEKKPSIEMGEYGLDVDHPEWLAAIQSRLAQD